MSLIVPNGTCEVCDRTLRPLDKLIGVPFAVRFTAELIQKSRELGRQRTVILQVGSTLEKVYKKNQCRAEWLLRKNAQLADSFPLERAMMELNRRVDMGAR